MATQLQALTPELMDWIKTQHIFFVATAAPDGRINLSPKGQSSLCVVNAHEILWLNLTGSGNETAAHLMQSNRMTMMWCAFDGLPNIVRLYGTVETIHPRDEAWQECATLLPPPAGTRQYFRLTIEMVQTSCGYAVPLMEYQEDRQVLARWTAKKGDAGVAAYWQEKNQVSIDGKPTGIFS